MLPNPLAGASAAADAPQTYATCYRALLDAAMDAVFMETLSGQVLDCNAAACRLYGYTRQELIGARVADLVPDEIARTLPDVATAVAAGAVRVEALGRKKDGTIFPIEVSTRLVSAPEPYVVAYVRDISARQEAERALQLSAAKYRLLVDNTYDWELWINPAGQVVYSSPSCQRVTGHAPEAFEADPGLLARLVHPDDRAAYAAHAQAERRGERGELTFCVVHADGTAHCIDHVCQPLYSAQDEFLGTRVSNRDITDAKRVEEKLAQTQSLLLASTEQSPAGIMVVEAPGLVIRTFNSAASTIMGLRPDEHPLDLPLAVYRPSWQAFRSDGITPYAFRDLPVARAALKGETMQNESMLIRRRDGTECWILSNSAPVRNPRGEIVAGITVFLDMTERQRSSEALRESEERYRCLLASVTSYVYTVEVREGRAVSTTHGPGCEMLTGYAAREYAANPLLWHSMVYDADKPAVTDQAARVLAGEGPLQLEHRIVCKNGAVRWVRNTSVPHFDAHGRLASYEGVLIDISDQKLAEAAQLRARDELEKRVEERTAELHAANRHLREMTRRVVMAQEEERQRLARELHDEAGQLLTGLKLTLEMGRRLPPDQVQQGLQHALEVVGDLIQRIRNLSLDLRPAMLDDLGLLPALLWHIDRYTAQTGVQVNFVHTGLETARFAPEIETAAYRIVQEALTNVARHSGVSEAIVRLWVDEATLNAQVEDHGVGFDPEAVLETMLTGATSFGLAGIRERVLLLEGQLTVESLPGQGARLTAELPLTKHSER